MWSSLVEYHRPATIEKSLRLLSREFPRTVLLAGGTWLVAQRDPQVGAVVDLDALDLAYVKPSARRFRLGAMTTLQALIETSSIQDLANGLLNQACSKSASRAIRNVATLGGTIVVGKSTSEVCLALLVLDAQVVIRNPTDCVFSLSNFFANQAGDLSSGGILTEIIVPREPASSGAASVQISRTPQDQPVVNAAVWVSRVGHICRAARLALGGIAAKPVRLPEIEAMISYQKIDAALCDRVAEAVREGIIIPPDEHSSAEYRGEMAGIVVSRALQEAWERVEKE